MSPGGLLRVLFASSALAACLVAPAAAQPAGPDGAPLEAWRFPVGERMEFSVSWGRVRLGEGSLEVEGVDTLQGRPAYRVAMEMWGGPPFYRVDDRQVSWIQPRPFGSLRFEQHLSEGSYKRNTRYLFDLDAMTYDRYDLVEDEWTARKGETAVEIFEGALDDISFLYFARLLPLEVGERYAFERYFKDKGNPVVIEVLRREEIRVPAGTFRTIVVRPIIQTGGAFGDGGEAELYLTDDDRRAIVRLRVGMAVGSGNLYLTSYEPGEGELIPVEPAGAASGAAEGPGPAGSAGP